MLKTFLAAGTAAFALAAQGAFAAGPTPAPADPVVLAPAPVVNTGGDWQGAYIGGQLGYGFGSFDAANQADDFDADGVVGGFHAGYLWDFGQWVVGPEIQFDFSDLSFDEDTGSGDFENILRLKVRGGYDLGQSLLYASAGFAYTSIEGEIDTLGGLTDIDFDDPGYTVGVGYDYQIDDRWVVGAEYQHHIFDDFGADDNDVDFGTVHVRTSFRF